EACLPFVQPQLVVGMLAGVAEIDGAPFDVEDTIRRTAGHRGEDTAGSARETRAARVYIGALVVPVWEDGVVVGCPRQRARVHPQDIRGGELGIAVGRQVDGVEGLVVHRVTEGERDGGYQVIRMVADVRRAWHDTAPNLRYDVMVWRRAALYRVIPREGRNTIAGVSSDRPGRNVRRPAASDIEL